MQTSHLENTGHSICCKRCHRSFPLPSRILTDPFQALVAKERIAGQHNCKIVPRNAQTETPRPYRTIPAARVTRIDRYWSKAVAELLPSA